MSEPRIQSVDALDGVEELDLLEEIELDEVHSPTPPRVFGETQSGRSSAPPPLPPEARRSSAPPGSLPPSRSGMFLIDRTGSVSHPPLSKTTTTAGQTIAPPPPIGSLPSDPQGELRAQMLQVDRLRLALRLRDDRIRDLDRAVLQLREQKQTLEQTIEQQRARIAELEQRPTAVVQDDADDLKRIAGVGPAFARKLQELGVTSFAHIAAWTPQDVLRIAETLNVSPRRIERDEWIAKASALVAAKSAHAPVSDADAPAAQ